MWHKIEASLHFQNALLILGLIHSQYLHCFVAVRRRNTRSVWTGYTALKPTSCFCCIWRYSVPKMRTRFSAQTTLFQVKLPQRLTFWIIATSTVSIAFYLTAFVVIIACSASTLLVVRHEGHPGCKKWVMRCLCGYLSGARCRLLAYGPADANASQNPIISCLTEIQTGFTFRVPAYPGCHGKEAVKGA